MDIDQGLQEFISRWIAVDSEDGDPAGGYFRFTRGRNASASRSCGVARVEVTEDAAQVFAEIQHLIEKLVQEEYRSPRNERCCLYVQYVERGATRHRDWCCVFDPGDVADALDAVGGPLGADLAGRIATGVIGEMLRQNNQLHQRCLGLLDSQLEMALSVGTGGSEMSEALEALAPTLQQVAASLPAIIQARALAAAAASSETDDQDPDQGTPQERADRELSNIESAATRLASLIMNDGAKITAKNKKRLKELATVIETVTA